ncbi:HAD family hydrolase [Cohnella sp. WQ 127256]|uniref:HAD family hydrolase n=1 Tax=Cohnella sp. WQ 127256 TaxID=2938790 RepID=UPI00211991E4|nr:HAD family hydrolase [Cohnella sp. WQ 127256]
MIFACDLDQTLIYSRKSMGIIDADELVPVETYENDYLSFMTRTAYHNLQQLSQQIHFVPATTRIYEQFQRIFGLNEGIRSRYAVISNGGRVLIEGKPDLDWENRVRETVRKECAPHDEIKLMFERLVHADCVIKDRYCDDLFYSIIVERDLLPPGLMVELEKLLRGYGWNCSLQGRKIYLVPDHVNKGAAVQYVKELSNSRSIFAAGDSLLDESMLVIANEAMAPKHGELYRKYGSHDHIRFTEHSGIRASEEIIDVLMKRMEVRDVI